MDSHLKQTYSVVCHNKYRITGKLSHNVSCLYVEGILNLGVFGAGAENCELQIAIAFCSYSA